MRRIYSTLINQFDYSLTTIIYIQLSVTYTYISNLPQSKHVTRSLQPIANLSPDLADATTT
jgi:hypothetical protein